MDWFTVREFDKRSFMQSVLNEIVRDFFSVFYSPKLRQISISTMSAYTVQNVVSEKHKRWYWKRLN